jgi:hypothetical protein
MRTLWKRAVVLCIAVALACGNVVPAGAQSSDDTGIIRIAVTSGSSHQPLANARVFLLGPSVASALTNKSGIVKYTDVASGLYRVRVSRSGYRQSTSAQFELLGEKEVDVDVALGPTVQEPGATTTSSTDADGRTVIGHVEASVTVNTRDVDQDSAIRRISDSLTDALNTVAGVDVTQSSNDPDAAQTISLHGHDESQTAVTLDGIPLSAPGTAANLRNLNTDLFAGSSVSFGASAGALGGGVNFMTLQPTQTWQERGSIAAGSFDKYNWSLGETGSIGKLGIALVATRRGGNNQLTFREYLDQSGQTYPHGGESANEGQLVKLRYGLTDNTTLTLTALQNNQATASLCTQFTGPVPCGIGPGNTTSGKTQFVYGTVQSLIGEIAVQATGYVSSQFNDQNELNRTIDMCVGSDVPCPVAEPFATDTNSLTRGIAAQGTISKDNHTITLNVATFASQTFFNPLVSSGTSTLVTPSLSAVASQTYGLNDQIKINHHLSVGPTLSLASTTGAGTSVLGGVSGDWRPSDADDFSLSTSIGSSQPAPTVVHSYSDPQSARVNCGGDTAQISGPGDQPTKQSAIDYQGSWTHTWTKGNVTIDVYRQSQAGQLINATVTAAAADLPAPIYSAVQGYYETVCPLSLPATIYVSQPVNGTTRIYQGYDITGRVALGRDVTAVPSYSTNLSYYSAADPQYTGVGSTLILNQQLYGRPIHKGNLTLDAFNPPSGIELLANAQYVGVNNQQHISPYVNVSFGISHPWGIGQLTLFETNAFNTETGLFSTVNGAIPEPLNGGGELIVAGNPLPPRTIQVSYSFNTGSRPGAGFARRYGGNAARAPSASASPAAAAPRGGLGFGQLHFISPGVGTDPLSLATARPECTADLRPVAQIALDQLRAAATAYAAGQPLPAVTGIAVSGVGRPSGTWYLDLGPDLPPGLFRRPGGAAGGGGEAGPGGRPPGGFGGGPGEGGPGGPGGPGGAPGGFTPQVRVAAPTTPAEPRPAFTPSPALIAALLPFRALTACAYGTVWTTAEAKAHGFDVPLPGAPAPDASPSPAASPAPGASPAPAGVRRARRGGFIHYAPSPGIFIVRPPELGTGGGSVKQ